MRGRESRGGGEAGALLTPFAYLQMIWTTAYGFALFGQLPDRWSAVGVTVIVASGLLLALRERRR